MMTISKLATATALASLLLVGGAFAQTAAPAAKDAAPKADGKMAKEAKPRTAESLECSKEADAKGLHGKERKKFRSECKKAGGAAAAPAAK
ncbi:PsiF family protein [Bradyrhizobium erythrophlei]|uniref:PsiF repeat-containing protein n=1 Tax=Bradyrhizobium erythrophlei TaxID=1437360 RepID=A0A1H5EUR4_9BRAD|nr:PsiF family protein [Bradyrhizobium erythrophlei]SED94820.1 psiF repeat-containing protein [Bradyrhizobium erythrophlei]